MDHKPVHALLAAGMAWASLVTAPPASANDISAVSMPESGYVLQYEGRFLGLRVMRATITLSLNDESYQARADFRAAGLAGFFVKSTVEASAEGDVVDGALVARQYRHVETLPNKVRRVQIDRTGQEVLVSIVPAFGDLGDPPATLAQKSEATDPVTGLLRMGLQRCVEAVAIFDSKLRYDLTVKTPPSREEPDACVIGYLPIAGFDASDLENPESYRAPVKTQLQRISDDLTVISRLSARVSGIPVSVRLVGTSVL